MDDDKKIDEKAWIAAWLIQAESAQDFIEEPDRETLNERELMAEIISDVMSGMLPAEEFLRRINLERIAQEQSSKKSAPCCIPLEALTQPSFPVQFPDPEEALGVEEGDEYPLIRLGATPPMRIPRKRE